MVVLSYDKGRLLDWRRGLLCLFLSAGLTACGGGGGGTESDNSAGSGSNETPSANPTAVANIQAGTSVRVGAALALDGSSSTVASGSRLSYQWTLLEKPAGSSASIRSAQSAQASLTADVPGSYRVRLTVQGSQGEQDDAEFSLLATTGNAKPTANAGSDQVVVVGTQVSLDGAASTDADGDALTYAWTLRGRPSGSRAALALANSAQPSFLADAAGNYTVDLIVSDGLTQSVKDTVVVSARSGNVAPRVNAGADLAIELGQWTILNGTATDGNNDLVKLEWSLVSVPAGSQLTLVFYDDPINTSIRFAPDLPGTYVYSLRGFDGLAYSAADTITLTVTSGNADGATLTQQKNCLACHTLTTKLIGPSFQSVRAKYATTAGNQDYLVQKIMKGSVGIWGQVPMPANTNVTATEANTLAAYILSLPSGK